MSGEARAAPPLALTIRGLAWLRNEWLLACFGLLALLLAVADPQPAARYREWLQWPTLGGLAGLLIAIQGIRDSGLVQRLAGSVVARSHSLRGLGVLLVATAALLATVLTNDVSLFVLVPLTLSIGQLSNLPVARMVVLEALAVNAGATLSPIGNPQNLLVWQHAGMPFLTFVAAVAPVAATMLGLVLALAMAWLPRGKVALSAEALVHRPAAPGLAVLSLGALAAMVVLMEYGQAVPAALGAGGVFLLAARRSLARVDWMLLLTFAVIFVGLGHLAALPSAQALLARLDLDHPLGLYASAIVLSQAVSNVPATVLLLDHAHDPLALAVAADVGGFGLAVGSLANLIALRLARLPRGLASFHRVSIPFLLVCAPLVWLVWRALGP